MDIQAAAIGITIFVISAGVLLFISLFGMKEKSYEEALAEQRQQTNGLLGTTNSKGKVKKVKKTKKLKEKQPSKDFESVEEEEVFPSTFSAVCNHKASAECQESAPVDVSKTSEVVENTTKEEDLPKKDQNKSVKPNQASNDQESTKAKPNKSSPEHKENASIVDSTKAKKEKQVQPVKEKKEKLYDNSKEKAVEPEKESVKDEQIMNSPNIHKQKKLSKIIKPEKEEPAVSVISIPPQTDYVVPTCKEKKKKKNELNILQQIAGVKEGDINLPLLLNIVREAELSRSEVQVFIELLLNKQHDLPSFVNEWSEGKADPIQKLKKQLAEKEKALAEEQEALLGAQAKLREIRAEQTAQRAHLQQRTKGLEEALQNKQLELQAASAHVVAQNNKIQQMQTQLNDLQLQRQQLDIHIAQAQEAEVTIQDLQARNNQLTMDLHALTEQNITAKEHQQNLIIQLQHQVNRFKSELDEKDNFVHQCEEMRRDLEHRLGLLHKQENDQKMELTHVKNVCQQQAEEIRRLEHGKGQAFEETKTLQKQKEDLEFNLAQLKRELLNLQTEQSELRAPKANGTSQQNQIHIEEVLNLQNELSSIKLERQSERQKYSVDIESYKTSLKQLQSELEEQKTKNNELRQKNWKVMNALKDAESRTVSCQKVDVDEVASKSVAEQETSRKLIQRILPDVQLPQSSNFDEWSVNVEKAIHRYISALKASKTADDEDTITKLKAEAQHYKSVVGGMEEMLKKLENHIQQEEMYWRNELENKEVEIEALKQQHS